MVRVARIKSGLERSIGGVGAARDASRQQKVDRVRDELDMAVLFSGDVRNQVVERPEFVPATEIEGLKRVIHQRRHLAELPSEQFLNG